MLRDSYWTFLTLSSSERNLKISYDLTKLEPNIYQLSLLDHSVHLHCVVETRHAVPLCDRL